MTLPKALDCWSYPAGADLKAAGFGAINAYIAGQGKALTHAVLEDYTANDIYVWLTWELEANAAEGGAAQAQSDATAALYAVHQLGLPTTKGVAIYGTNDAIVTEWAAVEAYFTRWASVISAAGYEPGIYADDTVINDMRAKNIPITRYWQTGAGSSSLLPYAHIYQGAPVDHYGYSQFQAFGRTCDADKIQSSMFGGVNLNGVYAPVAPPPVPPPPPAPTPTENEMLFIAQSPTGTASFLYDTQAKTRRGLSQGASVTLLEAVGIKNYGATLDKTVLATFALEANWD